MLFAYQTQSNWPLWVKRAKVSKKGVCLALDMELQTSAFPRFLCLLRTPVEVAWLLPARAFFSRLLLLTPCDQLTSAASFWLIIRCPKKYPTVWSFIWAAARKQQLEITWSRKDDTSERGKRNFTLSIYHNMSKSSTERQIQAQIKRHESRQLAFSPWIFCSVACQLFFDATVPPSEQE